MVRKGLFAVPEEESVTKVFDHVSATIPDQTIPLRDMIMKFAYIGSERVEEIVNRGFYGDEDDDDILGVDVGALDFAEIHDRIRTLETALQNRAKVVHAPVVEPLAEPPAEPPAVGQPSDAPAE